MKYKILGRSGLRVSELCLGTMTFGEETGIGADETTSRKIYDAFLEAGGNFIDTANIYTLGTSERMLGKFIGTDRERLVIGSKFSMTTDTSDLNAGGNHRKNLHQAVQASLGRLKTDYLDILWVHGWDLVSRQGEMMRALDDLVRSGSVLHIAVSNMPAWLIAANNVLAEERGWSGFSAMQLQYNLGERSIEAEFLPLAEYQDMAVTSWSPLAGGLLTDKFAADANADASAGSRLKTSEWGRLGLAPEKLELAGELCRIAAECGCSAAQLALAWQLRRDGVSVIPIIGARNPEQLEDNLASIAVDPGEEVMRRLNALSPPAAHYPETLLENDFYRAMIHGENRENLADLAKLPQ